MTERIGSAWFRLAICRTRGTRRAVGKGIGLVCAKKIMRYIFLNVKRK